MWCLLPSGIYNRVDEVVFHPLGEQHIASIAQIQLNPCKRLEERGYEIHI